MQNPRVILALDFSNQADALTLVQQLNPSDCRLKVGKELFTRLGPDFVRRLQDMGFEVFLDLKYHDIPNTVAAACKAAAQLGVWMLNVHASGGRRMMLAAREALEGAVRRPLLLGVTVLTSMEADDLTELGITYSPEHLVLRLASLGARSGLDGVVCSPLETQGIRQQLGNEFLLVTPGIRLPDSSADDQRRVQTPASAIANGSSYLVIGRPITQATNPAQVLESINQAIRQQPLAATDPGATPGQQVQP